MLDFTVESFYTPTLAEGADHLTAITEVRAGGDGAVAARQDTALLFVVDKSGSMRGGRIAAVKSAVRKAVGLLDETTIFGVIAFTETAEVIVRPQRATQAAKVDADMRLRRLEGDGGTCMSTGLALARDLFGSMPGAIHQAIFLTDGENDKADNSRVSQVLRSIEKDAAGRFECDCWGVGTDWKVGQVQEIARALLGKASIIPDPSGVEAAFRAAAEKATSKAVSNVRLRLWTPVTAQVALLKQMNPTIEDLTARAVRINPQAVEYPTGSWAPGESREYQIDLRVQPGAIGEEMLAARPSIVYDAGGQPREIKAPAGRVVLTWTADEALSSRINPRVAHYTGQAELAAAIQDGLEARERGDQAAATHLLGKAVKIAHDSGNDEMTARLKKVVDIEDAASGTVRLRRSVDKASTMDLELESTTTKRARRG